MRTRRTRMAAAVVAATALVLAACGAEVDDDAADTTTDAEDDGDDAADDGDDDAGDEGDDAADDAGDDGDDGDDAAEGDGDTMDVSFVAFTMDITEMAGQQLAGLEHEFEEQGVDFNLDTAAPAGAEDHEGMDRILQDVATAAPDYAIVNPASYSLVDSRLADIADAGTTVIVGNIDPETLEDPPSVDPLTWVAVDEYGMGNVGGEFMAQQYCDEGREDVKVVPFWGPAASEISQDRIGGALDALEEGFDECGIEWEVSIDDIFAEFDRELAFNLTENVVTSVPDVDLLIGANSNTALGIMEALSAQGRLEDIDVMGNGGQLDELAAICRGDIAAAGFRDAFEMGRNMARAAIMDWEGNTEEVPEVTLSELPVTHDCDTVFEYVPMEMLDNDGFRDNLPEGTWEEYVG